MTALRRLYRWLVRRLPPRAAWGVWRAAVLAASPRRARVPRTVVALAHVAWGASDEELGALVEHLPARAGAPRSEVLVVSDCDSVHLAAAAGCRLEYVPGRADWERAFPGADYEAFLLARGLAIGRAFSIGRVEAPEGAPEPLRRALEEAAAKATG